MSEKAVSTPEFRPFINDGYVRLGYIEEKARLHPAVRFQYRPMLADERDVLLSAAQRLTPKQLAERINLALAKRIVEWDILDGERAVEITQENLGRIEPNLRDRLFWIVSGSPVAGDRHISDIDPKWAKHEGTSEIDEELDAACNGINREAKDAGN